MAWSPWSSHRMAATPGYPWLPPLPPRDPATPPLAGGGGRGHHAPCRHSLIYLSKNNIPLCKSIPLPSIAPSAKTVKDPPPQHQPKVQHIYPMYLYPFIFDLNRFKSLTNYVLFNRCLFPSLLSLYILALLYFSTSTQLSPIPPLFLPRVESS